MYSLAILESNEGGGYSDYVTEWLWAVARANIEMNLLQNQFMKLLII